MFVSKHTRHFPALFTEDHFIFNSAFNYSAPLPFVFCYRIPKILRVSSTPSIQPKNPTTPCEPLTSSDRQQTPKRHNNNTVMQLLCVTKTLSLQSNKKQHNAKGLNYSSTCTQTFEKHFQRRTSELAAPDVAKWDLKELLIP